MMVNGSCGVWCPEWPSESVFLAKFRFEIFSGMSRECLRRACRWARSVEMTIIVVCEMGYDDDTATWHITSKVCLAAATSVWPTRLSGDK